MRRGGAVLGRGTALASLVALLGAIPVAATEIRAADPYPLVGRATTIEVSSAGAPVPGAEVEVLHRPNSEAASLDRLGRTDAAGRVSWSPADAGLARITATGPDGAIEAQLDVAIRWGRMPRAGLLILVLAAALLFGGAGTGLVLVARADRPPST